MANTDVREVVDAVAEREKNAPAGLEDPKVREAKLNHDAGNRYVPPVETDLSDNVVQDRAANLNWFHENEYQVLGNADGPEGGVIIVGPGPNYSAADYASAADAVRRAEEREAQDREEAKAQAKADARKAPASKS